LVVTTVTPIINAVSMTTVQTSLPTCILCKLEPVTTQN